MFKKFATDKYRWVALVFLALGLAIVVIDNTVLNVAIPYILRDLNTSLDSLEWVISGYALIIATLLITTGRLGDMWGRKRVFILGTILFAIGSFIASLAQNIQILFFGESLIEAIGAAMMLTSTLSLLASEFRGRERAIAFGIWGAVAGASASVGPLLGGYLTTYQSWRWSLRINVLVAIIAIAGSIFIKESKGEDGKKFDWLGTLFSGSGLFFLVFSLIEGRKYGWFSPNENFTSNGFTWPFENVSIIPFTFLLSAILLSAFALTEYWIEKRGGSPLLKPSMFKNWGFSMGLLTVGIVSLGQLGLFFVFPIYVQNVLGYTAFDTGLVFLPTSITVFICGAASGFLSSKFGPKWIVSIGMFILSLGTLLLIPAISTQATGWSLAPVLVVFGVGMGLATAQLTNLVLSAVPTSLAGEASGANATMRQVGSAIGIAVIGAVFTSALTLGITDRINADLAIPEPAKQKIIEVAHESSTQLGSQNSQSTLPPSVVVAIKSDINESLVSASKAAVGMAFVFVLAGSVASLVIPAQKEVHTADHRNRSS